MPAWIALTSVQLLAFAMTRIETPGFVAAQTSSRVVQLLILVVPVALAYRAALALPFAHGRRALCVVGNVLLAAAVSMANRPALLLASASDVREVVAASPGQFPQLDFESWLHLSLVEGRSLLLWIASSLTGLVCYAGGLGLMTALRIAIAGRDERLRAEALQLAWTRARLQALRMQLNPHFLFNALNTVVGLIETDVGRAREVVIRLGDLLRRSLANGQREWCPLAEELAMARDYVSIQQARFCDRLELRIESSPSADAVAVPTMILQPLIENAVLHGIGDDRDSLTVWIRAVARDGLDACLELEVVNRTNGRLPAAAGVLRIGLGNLQRRLAAEYGDRARVSFGATDESTYRVELVLPVAVRTSRRAAGASP